MFVALPHSATAEDAALHSAIKPVPRAGGWMTRHEKFNDRVKQGNVDLIFIGSRKHRGDHSEGRGHHDRHE